MLDYHELDSVIRGILLSLFAHVALINKGHIDRVIGSFPDLLCSTQPWVIHNLSSCTN